MLTAAAAAMAQDISGIAVDEISGLPVPAASVRLHPDGMPGGGVQSRWISATTGGDGKFVIHNAAVGKYSLDCSKPGYVTEDVRSHRGPVVEVKASGDVEPAFLKIRLTPAAVLAGQVLTAEGKPIANAVISWPTGGGRESVHASAAGDFELTGLGPCSKDCRLLVEIGEPSRRQSLVKVAGTNTILGPPDWVEKPVGPWIAGQHIRNLELRVDNEKLVTFSGVVVNPPQDAEVTLERSLNHSYMPSNAPMKDGKFQFDLLPVGDYRLRVRKRMDFQSAPSEVSIRLDADLIGHEITLPKPLSISGVVRMDGKPYHQPGLDVSLSSRANGTYLMARGKVREDGTFDVEGLAPGKWFVGAGMSGVPGQPLRSLPQGAFREVEIVDGPNEPLVVDVFQTFTVRGQIVDAQGLPVPGSVILKKSPADAQFLPSDRLGAFGSGVLPGTYLVTAWRSGDAADHRNLPECPTARTLVISGELQSLKLQVCR